MADVQSGIESGQYLELSRADKALGVAEGAVAGEGADVALAQVDVRLEVLLGQTDTLSLRARSEVMQTHALE